MIVGCPGWKSSQAAQGSGVCDVGGAKSKKAGSVHTVHSRNSQASKQPFKASKLMMNVAASGPCDRSMRNECAREECGSKDMRYVGVQASQCNKLRCAKMNCMCTSSGGNLKNQEGVNLAASETSKFGNKKFLKGGRGETGESSCSLSLTSSPKHTFKCDGEYTPIKRKLIQQNNISRLISNFEDIVVPDTHWNEVNGSPAKRRKTTIFN